MYKSLISALRRPRQMDLHEFENHLVYTVSSRTVRTAEKDLV